MERLTKSKIDIEKFSEKAKSRLTKEYIEKVKLNNKLAEFEDFMEEQEFTSLEDLKAYIKLQSNGSKNLIQENQALKDRWQKLKEWALYPRCFELLAKIQELEKEQKWNKK